jgi:hydrogenase maturation protease
MTTIRTLVIGYGNRLRSDDGVGPAVAEMVASWRIPGVRALAVSQLTPELVDELKNAERVLFVDAASEPLDVSFATCIVEPKKSSRTIGHHSDSAHVLALTCDLEGRCLEAWMLMIGVHSFEFGESITELAQANMKAACVSIRPWLVAARMGTPIRSA